MCNYQNSSKIGPISLRFQFPCAWLQSSVILKQMLSRYALPHLRYCECAFWKPFLAYSLGIIFLYRALWLHSGWLLHSLSSGILFKRRTLIFVAFRMLNALFRKSSIKVVEVNVKWGMKLPKQRKGAVFTWKTHSKCIIHFIRAHSIIVHTFITAILKPTAFQHHIQIHCSHMHKLIIE